MRGYLNRYGVLVAWVWNVFLAAGLLSLPLGYNHGLEAGELPLLAEIPIFICTVIATLQFLTTIGRRLDPSLYVSLWYLIGAFVWTSLNLVLGSFVLPYSIAGINSPRRPSRPISITTGSSHTAAW